MGTLTRRQVIRKVGTDITITRPADTTAYAVGDVYGADGDARIALNVPTAPPGMRLIAYNILGILHREPGGNTLTAALYMFSAQPATIIDDNAPLTLSDADIDLLIMESTNTGGAAFTFSFGTGAAAGGLNMTATTDGRRASYGLFTPTIGGSSAQEFAPATLTTPTHAYLVVTSAYTPVSGEVLVLRPIAYFAADERT